MSATCLVAIALADVATVVALVAWLTICAVLPFVAAAEPALYAFTAYILLLIAYALPATDRAAELAAIACLPALATNVASRLIAADCTLTDFAIFAA